MVAASQRSGLECAPDSFLGSSNASIIYLEITPLVFSSTKQPPQLSTAIAKHRLKTWSLMSTVRSIMAQGDEKVQRMMLRPVSNFLSNVSNVEMGKPTLELDSQNQTDLQAGYLRIDYGCGKEMEEEHTAILVEDIDPNHEDKCTPVVYLPSDDPLQIDPIPCHIRAYATGSRFMPKDIERSASVTDSTLVRILPPQLAVKNSESIGQVVRPPSWFASDRLLQRLSAEIPAEGSEEMELEVLSVHGFQTVQSLKLRMEEMLSVPVRIGTTAGALQTEALQQKRTRSMISSIDRWIDKRSSTKRNIPWKEISKAPAIPWDPTLIVHSPEHASGKTILVKAIAKRKLGCPEVYVLSAPALIAKYGVYADAGLESWLHGTLMSAAVSNKRICIILDHLESMLPPRLSGCTSSGDAAVPSLHSIASFLKRLAKNLRQRQQVPFPIQNKLYNEAETSGCVLPVRFCLIGIVTCPDGGWRSKSNSSRLFAGNESILDGFGGGRFRLPSLDSTSRLSAVRFVIEREGIVLNDEATTELPEIAAKLVWAKGDSFRKIGRSLRSIARGKSGSTDDLIASLADVKLAISSVRKSINGIFPKVDIQGLPDGDSSTADKKEGLFESIGGNGSAKRALADALALDPIKRQLLHSFGMSPPIGILLYGPPGCGKTMLAKAVAIILNTQIPSGESKNASLSGSFISLSSSAIVRAEIGTSEKLVVEAFEMARKSAPSVIFIDEFQALFTERSSSSSSKLATTLLQCMDDIRRWGNINRSGNERETENSGRIVVLGATNTPWMIDKAFLRAGRFDRVVHVALPTQEERQSILRVLMKDMKLREAKCSDQFDALCSRIASMSSGLSGADLAALCRAAAIGCLMGDEQNENASAHDEIFVEERHFLNSLKHDIAASSNQELVAQLLRWKP